MQRQIVDEDIARGGIKINKKAHSNYAYGYYYNKKESEKPKQ